MVTYWATTPFWMKMLFPRGLVWDMPAIEPPTVYITFDDGPHPTATSYALEQLEKYGAHATFFCVGNNVTKFPAIYNEVVKKGHTTANHTYNHMNGWKNDNAAYIDNIEKAAAYINSKLFRPPYGMIKAAQAKEIKQHHPDWKIIMWSVLSGDFDRALSPEKCLRNVLDHIKPGSIVLFHDSEKAWERMSYALPKVLEYCRNKGWKMEALH